MFVAKSHPFNPARREQERSIDINVKLYNCLSAMARNSMPPPSSSAPPEICRHVTAKGAEGSDEFRFARPRVGALRENALAVPSAGTLLVTVTEKPSTKADTRNETAE